MKSVAFFASIVLLILSSLAYGRNQLTINYTKTDVSCASSNNGSIILSISGGNKPYTIQWNQGSCGLELKNLRGGIYSVLVSDSKGLFVNQEIIIEEPLPLGFYYNSKNLTDAAEFNGVMDISIFGGSPWDSQNEENYFLRLNGKSYYEHPENLKDGKYELSIEDSRGCKLSMKVNLNIEVVKSMSEISLIKSDHSFNQENIGSVNMYIIHHDLIHSSMLQNDSNASNLSLSVR